MAISTPPSRGNRDQPNFPLSGKAAGASIGLTDDERATARPMIEAKVEEFAAHLPPKAKALIVAAALQNPSLAQQMRTGGISFGSSIVQNAVQAAISDVQAGKTESANVLARRANPNTPEPESSLLGPRQGGAPAAMRAMDKEMRERTSRSSADYDSLHSSGNYSAANYSGSPFARAGVSYATYSDLRAQGFNGQQITGAMNFSRELGLNADRSVAPLARIHRDVPSAEAGLRVTRDGWKKVGELERQEREARERGDAAAAEKLHQQAMEARKRTEEHDQHEREHVQKVAPQRVPDVTDVQGQIRKRYLGNDAKPEVKNDSSVLNRQASLKIGSGPTRKHKAAAAKSGQAIQAAASAEPQRQQTKAARAAMFGAAPEASQPTQHAAATPAEPAKKDAPQKLAEAAAPIRPTAGRPRAAAPTAQA